mgnify:CR=1 FL=1
MALTAKKVYAILKHQISDMEAKLNSPVRYRGTVATADLLPLNPDIGDMYNIESKSIYGEAGMNVAWNGVVWDTMGAPIDMSLYLTKEGADTIIQNMVNEYLEKNPVKPGATTEQAQQIEQNKTDIVSLKTETGSLKEDLGEKGTTLTDIQKKMSDSNSNDGFLLCDLNGNIVGHIASFEVWNNEPYNKKYGWGGHPYGDGKLPPYSKIAGVFEADLLSVCGGKGRWNKDDTGNFQHGGHLFEGWNAEEDARLTFGIGTKNKDISWIQTFHAATQEGSDSGAYYCVTKVGSDIDNQGMNFMPSITQSRSLFSLKVGNNLAPKTEHIQKLVETGELTNWEYNATDMVPYGTMYFDYDKDKVRVYTRTGGWKYLKFEEEV